MTYETGTRVDLHVKILDEEVVRRAKDAGLDILVYAPHFTHISTARERAERYTDDDLLVVPARECFTGRWNDRQHVLAIDPDKPIPDFVTLADTMDELRRQDATVLAPHPGFLTMSLEREDVLEYRDLIDAVEVYCPKHWSWHNRRARSIAADADLPTYASSYAHLRPTIGEVWVEFEESIENATQLRAAIDRGAPRELHHETGVGHELNRKVEFFHLTWENTWEKFKRVALEDIEQTNPFNPIYEGRFDDVSAY